MNYEGLEKNLIDNICEAQLKIGYEKRPISFNYTSKSLCHILGVNTVNDDILAEFKSDKIGAISFRAIKSGYCITVSETGTEYVHENYKGGFIADLIDTVRQHGKSVDDVFDVFNKYGKVCIQKSNNEEFDWLVYFENGIPDSYYYCITDEGLHVTYHRFIKEDYEDFNF
ncbi:MAG: DUF3877 family protein [Ruminococcus sp.]|nr:DUF3877 family protein [Ruminococcus sp.]